MGTYKFSCEGSEYYLPVVNRSGGTSVDNPENLLYKGNRFLKYPDISSFDVSGITEGFPADGSYEILQGDSNGWDSKWACPPVVIYDIGNNIRIAPAVIFAKTDKGFYSILTFYVYNPLISETNWETHNFCYTTSFEGYRENPELALNDLFSFPKVNGFMVCFRVDPTIFDITSITSDTNGKFNHIYLKDGDLITWKGGNSENIKESLSFSTDIPIYDDPFGPGGNSGEGGGGGDFDNTSTPIEIPGLPTVSAASTGFISLFNPTLSQLNELASYLWSDLFEIDGWKKLFADPMDAILGLSILPVPIPTSGPKEVKVGNIGTGISLNVASTQFVEVECGSINVNEYWGAYLDYSPYTQCQIYLPYVGTRPISIDEIMGKTVNVKYHVDILTGACCCFIKCGDSILYTFNGQCSIPIPINSANYTSVINGIISVAASVGSMIATGGASAPLAIPHLASTVANQMKPNIEKSGAISGSGAVLNIQTPYLILTRPRQALPKDQNTFTGYPSFVTVTLGELSGYTEVYNIHLENIPATADEISEIENLLKGGVIF